MGLGKQTLGEHKQNLLHTRTQEKGAATSQETDPDLPGSVQSLQKNMGQCWLAAGLGGTECHSACMGPFEGGPHYLHYLHLNLAPGK